MSKRCVSGSAGMFIILLVVSAILFSIGGARWSKNSGLEESECKILSYDGCKWRVAVKCEMCSTWYERTAYEDPYESCAAANHTSGICFARLLGPVYWKKANAAPYMIAGLVCFSAATILILSTAAYVVCTDK